MRDLRKEYEVKKSNKVKKLQDQTYKKISYKNTVMLTFPLYVKMKNSFLFL